MCVMYCVLYEIISVNYCVYDIVSVIYCALYDIVSYNMIEYLYQRHACCDVLYII